MYFYIHLNVDNMQFTECRNFDVETNAEVLFTVLIELYKNT